MDIILFLHKSENPNQNQAFPHRQTPSLSYSDACFAWVVAASLILNPNKMIQLYTCIDPPKDEIETNKIELPLLVDNNVDEDEDEDEDEAEAEAEAEAEDEDEDGICTCQGFLLKLSSMIQIKQMPTNKNLEM